MLRLALWIFTFSAILYTLFGFELEGKTVSDHLGDIWDSPVCVEKRQVFSRHVKLDKHWQRLRHKLLNYMVPEWADDKALRNVDTALREAAGGETQQVISPKVIDHMSKTEAESGLNHLINRVNKEP